MLHITAGFKMCCLYTGLKRVYMPTECPVLPSQLREVLQQQEQGWRDTAIHHLAELKLWLQIGGEVIHQGPTDPFSTGTEFRLTSTFLLLDCLLSFLASGLGTKCDTTLMYLAGHLTSCWWVGDGDSTKVRGIGRIQELDVYILS